MTDSTDSLPQHKDDFDRVYDLEDPSRYFTALRPSGYRMPEVMAGVLRAIHRPVCAARGAGDTLRILDFACGYGAVGALLRHDISMAAVYARYGARHWRPVDARRYWEADAAFFAARRDASGKRSRLAASTSPGLRWSTPRLWGSSTGPFTRTSWRARRAGR